jgi:hypothetical protein
MARSKWRVVGVRSNKRRIAMDGCSSMMRAERLRRLLLATEDFDEVLIEPDKGPEPHDIPERKARHRP